MLELKLQAVGYKGPEAQKAGDWFKCSAFANANHKVRPNKEKSKQKIDGIVALIIALSRVIAGAGLGSGYDARVRADTEHILRSL